MDDAGQQNHDADIRDSLRAYCIRVVRFVSDGALDPHLYFETKFVGDVTVAESAGELIEILSGLADWIDETDHDSNRVSVFDRSLVRDGLPSLSLLCDAETRSGGLILACGRIRTNKERRIMRELVASDAVSDGDKSTAEEMLIAYEHR